MVACLSGSDNTKRLSQLRQPFLFKNQTLNKEDNSLDIIAL
jgi:hypothetical protein